MRLNLYTIVIFTIFLTNSSLKAGPNEVLSQLGFTPLGGEAKNFSLPDLAGKNVNLSDFRGKWVWLVFWATWCGPCASEMPVLERIFKKFRASRFSIVAVSVDDDSGPIQTFIKEYGLTFPVVHDRGGVISRQYKAYSLPTLFAISPDRKLSGMIRGAVSWDEDEVSKVIQKLLQFKKGEGDGGATLESLSPPVLEVYLPDGVSDTFKNIPFEVGIRWKGDPNEYRIKTPKLTLPDGVTMSPQVSSYSSNEFESSSLRFKFLLDVKKEGTFNIGPIELSYSDALGGGEQFAQSKGIELSVKRSSRWVKALALISGLLSALGSLFLIIRHRKKKRAMKETAIPNVLEKLEEVKQQKMKLDKKQYTLRLLKLNLQIIKNKGEEDSKLLRLIEKIEFGGHLPLDEEVEAFEKQLEREHRS